jgi:Fe-S cluster assembly iron-binding protein IscA
MLVCRHRLRCKNALEPVFFAAANRLKQLRLESADKKNFRLGVKSRGCNGMSYTLDYADKPDKFEDVVQDKGASSSTFFEDGALIVVVRRRYNFHYATSVYECDW